jgi:hypothetical protein
LLIEQLRKAWRARETRGVLDDRPRFEADALVLGAGTVLVAGAAGGADEPPDDEARLRALLLAAYGRPVASEALGHLKAATARWRQGHAGAADLHLALARLDRLEPPGEAARRLFMADGLMRGGVAPETIIEALAPADGAALKYSQDQPRVPAGSGRTSGRWTAGGGGGAGGGASPDGRHSASAARSASAPAPASRKPTPPSPTHPRMQAAAAHPPARRAQTDATRANPTGLGSAIAIAADTGATEGAIDLGALSAATVGRLAAFVGMLADSGLIATTIAGAGAVAAFGIIVVPSTGPKGKWIDVGGLGNLSYFRQPDETAIRFRYTDASGMQRTFSASPDPDGKYRGPDGRVIARWVKTAAKMALVIAPAAFAGADTDTGRPNLCPALQMDRPGARPKDRDYEDYVKKIVNDPPTPRGFGYAFVNPTNGNPVYFDDCHRPSGTMVDAKGTGYAEHLRKKDFIWDGMLVEMREQADRQERAAGGRSIMWFFAEKSVADAVRHEFRDRHHRIRVVCLPWTVGMK